jgi:hypothetical protein
MVRAPLGGIPLPDAHKAEGGVAEFPAISIIGSNPSSMSSGSTFFSNQAMSFDATLPGIPGLKILKLRSPVLRLYSNTTLADIRRLASEVSAISRSNTDSMLFTNLVLPNCAALPIFWCEPLNQALACLTGQHLLTRPEK